MKIYINIFLFLFVQIYISAQISINNTDTPPDVSSLLDVSSETKGVLIPRIDDLSLIELPAESLIVYDTQRKCITQNIGTRSLPEWACMSPNTTSFFYMPSIVFNVDSSNQNVRSIELYDEYISQFQGVPANQTSLGVVNNIPYFPSANDLYYYVTGFDEDVFDIIGITSTGTLTYTIKPTAIPSKSTFINIVFVSK